MDPTGAEKAHDHDDDSGVCAHVSICVYVHDHMCTHACGDQRSMSNAFISCSLYVLLRQTLSLKLKLADGARLLWEAAVALGLQAHTATPCFSHGCLLPKFRPFCLRSEHLPG